MDSPISIGGHIIFKNLIYLNHYKYIKLPERLLIYILTEVGAPLKIKIQTIYFVIDTYNIYVFIKIRGYPYFYSENPQIILEFCRTINPSKSDIQMIKEGNFNVKFRVNSHTNLQKYVATEHGRNQLLTVWFYFPNDIKKDKM